MTWGLAQWIACGIGTIGAAGLWWILEHGADLDLTRGRDL